MNSVYLGNVIRNDSTSLQMENLYKDFARQIYFLLSNFKLCSFDVKYHPMKRYCMSLYGVFYMI